MSQNSRGDIACESMSPSPRIAGADGCKAGWLLVQATRLGARVEHAVCATAAELVAHTAPDGIVGVDIPIGLTSAGSRSADRAAREVLGPRRSSIFFAPLRVTLGAATHAEANQLSRQYSGKGISQQTFHISRKIAEMDDVLRADASAAARVHEVHPEVCFTVLNGDRPMQHPKKQAAGQAERLALIDALFPGAFDAIRAAYARKDVASDDILDALVALWTASRIRAGTALSFPEGPVHRDAHGLAMVIRA